MNLKNHPSSIAAKAGTQVQLTLPVAVLWDQSHVWGWICVETLTRFGVPFHLLSAREIADGHLARYRILIVPGGWAAHRVEALGAEGKDEIADFVRAGGGYLGFCGGAGLALSSPPALGLVPLKRMAPSERLPNASGGVWIRGTSSHPAWKDLPLHLPVSIWWPSQFATESLPGALALASYTEPGEDFRVADLPLGDLRQHDVNWNEWEKIYGINLDPGRLMNHTAINEIPLSLGKLVLSYPHLETPGDSWGNRLLLNILACLDREAAEALPGREAPVAPPCRFDIPPGHRTMEHLARMRDAADDLIAFGQRHLLWQWRRPWLLSWRRGIRGLEYGSLSVMVHAILAETPVMGTKDGASDPWTEPAGELAEKVRQFCGLAKQLLLQEKLASLTGSVKKLGSVNDSVDGMRKDLFGDGMSPDGLCRVLFGRLEDFLLEMSRLGRGRPESSSPVRC